jgi:hypothetical protein
MLDSPEPSPVVDVDDVTAAAVQLIALERHRRQMDTGTRAGRRNTRPTGISPPRSARPRCSWQGRNPHRAPTGTTKHGVAGQLRCPRPGARGSAPLREKVPQRP